ncbi:hypothetical protein [Chryseobacterium indologenes]|uniref:hypothetical protein n=1 Tax=Chryseobacterium indologenes TaxID=253 RepID=UPI0010243B09|nr:hypothetical protein [Chryseobacterium indologenes]VFA43423.1 Uncharacterised protein [Chryseobacterium indologenes]
MKKTLFILSSVLFIGCASSNDLVYSQDDNKYLSPNLNDSALRSEAMSLSASNTSELVVMDLSFTTGTLNRDGGCTFQDLIRPEGNWFESTACYGPIPLEQNGYMIRGYGKPRRGQSHNNFKGVLLETENKPIRIENQSLFMDYATSNVLSIEFPFQANKTYQIILTTEMTDIIYNIKNDPYSTPMDDDYDINQSQSLPIVGVELSLTPEIPGSYPCSDRPLNIPVIFDKNYYKTEQPLLFTRVNENKNIVFIFSTTEARNGLIIYFFPELAKERTSSYVPQSKYRMDLKNVKIIQKPFDPFFFIKTNPIGPTCPGGMRVC